MSRSARRLAGTVGIRRFDWQAAAPRALQPTPVVFAEVPKPSRPVSEAAVPVEARELHLPSVSAARLEAIEQEAYAAGFARGDEAGREQAARDLDQATRALAATIEELSLLRPALMRRADRELIHLALAMAERILRRELQADPASFLIMVRAAIDRLGHRTAAVVHLHPDDHAAVTATVPEHDGLELVADPAVARGGCLIRSALGLIDAGIDAQIRELSRALLDDDAGEETARGVAGS